MLYYRYWIEKEFDGQIRKTDKAIGLEICQRSWVYHEGNTKYLWVAKSQVIIEEEDWKEGKVVNYYIPVWIVKKNHLEYSSFDGIGTIRGRENYEVER